MQHIAILGNGIAGISAARQIRKNSNHKITVISGETDHFFSRTALMYIYMGHMKFEHTKPYEDWFWDKNDIKLHRGWVEKVDFELNELAFTNGEKLEYDQLVLATGSKSNRFGWPGQDLEGVQGLYSYQDLEVMEKNTQKIQEAVVVGGGLIGVEMAEMLHSRGIHVTFLVRETHFWDIVLTENEAKLIDRHILSRGIDLKLSTELKEILDDGTGRVKGVRTNKDETIDCQFVGLTVGVSPNIDFLKDSKLEIQKGILVNEFLETSIPNVFAIGDCAQVREPNPNRRPLEPVWYTGRIMGETLGKTLSGNRTAYQPGIWFNSAKFFDIEYQTYGLVSAKPRDTEGQFYWENDAGDKCITISYNLSNFKVLGINTFGIRMRHEVWDQWIRENRSLAYAVENLRKANFDPEFFKPYDQEIQKSFNSAFPDQAINVRKSGFLEKIFN
jgi:NAD(P)H-nitrite reductase large subunit